MNFAQEVGGNFFVLVSFFWLSRFLSRRTIIIVMRRNITVIKHYIIRPLVCLAVTMLLMSGEALSE